jgi:hypothetical protein
MSWMTKHVNYQQLTTSFDVGHVGVVANNEHRKALQWYNRALVGFRAMLEKGPDEGYVLLSCILFAGFEFQQRKVGDALKLMGNALAYFDRSFLLSPRKYLSSTADDICDWIVPFFTRKAMELATLVWPLSIDWEQFVDTGSLSAASVAQLSLLQDAKSRLDRLMYDAYEITRVTDLISNDDEAKRTVRIKQQVLLRDLQSWQGGLPENRAGLMDVGLSYIRTLLMMHWEITQIWLRARPELVQTAFDRHTEAFKIVLARARFALDYLGTNQQREYLRSRKMDLVAPLYFVATKCREPTVRREALEMLRRAPLRDELWSLMASPFVVQKIMEIEEGTNPFTVPPEANRIHQIAIVKQDVRDGRSRMQLQISRVSLDSKGLWQMAHEDVWVDCCTLSR